MNSVLSTGSPQNEDKSTHAPNEESFIITAILNKPSEQKEGGKFEVLQTEQDPNPYLLCNLSHSQAEQQMQQSLHSTLRSTDTTGDNNSLQTLQLMREAFQESTHSIDSLLRENLTQKATIKRYRQLMNQTLTKHTTKEKKLQFKKDVSRQQVSTTGFEPNLATPAPDSVYNMPSSPPNIKESINNIIASQILIEQEDSQSRTPCRSARGRQESERSLIMNALRPELRVDTKRSSGNKQRELSQESIKSR